MIKKFLLPSNVLLLTHSLCLGFEWNSANLYLVLPDRFLNADTSNDFGRNLQGHPAWRFAGGDLRGLTKKLIKVDKPPQRVENQPMKTSTFLTALTLTLTCLLGLTLLGLPSTNNSALAPGLLFLLPLLGLVALAARALPHTSAPHWGLEARLFLHILFHAVATFLLALLAVLLIDAEASKPYAVVILTMPLFALIAVRFLSGPKDCPLGKTLTRKVGQLLEIK